jgi:hypothetical protein
MILSKKHKFLYIKGRKVASTSFEVLLSSICGPEDIITPITPIDELYRISQGFKCAQNYGDNIENQEYIRSLKLLNDDEIAHLKPPKGKFYNHIGYTEILEINPSLLTDIKVYAIERCPYRKILSLANMILNIKEYKKTGETMKSDAKLLRNQVSKLIENGEIRRVKNIELYKDKQGKIVPTVLRFENLEEDTLKFMKQLGLKAPPKIKPLKPGVSSQKFKILEMFDIGQLQVINEIFEEEFLQFKYPQYG